MTGRLGARDRERLETLFDRAADLPAAERPAFVERECGSNEALRDELARLLAGLGGADLLGRVQVAATSCAGTRIGPYELLEKIGEGGMGEVYLAEQRAPLERRVALKLIKPGMDSARIVRRFEAERQTLALMAHPSIAQVLDGGATDDARPYFVMEHVDGEALTDHCDRRRLPTCARLALFLAVCDGVQHAHQRGVIHRDLKPSNLLVSEQGGRASPKIIDFGVARATTGPLAERTQQTEPGQVVGTLDYMSPEQADPTGLELDTRSDIYSLGVVLYQLLSGLLPFRRSSAPGAPLSELQRAIREEDPPTPSARLRRDTATATEIAPLHGTDERALVRQLAGDLDWICLKALEKDPARRYQSVHELAEDIRRHLAHQPVLAGRPDALYRARKFVRRHRVGVTAGLLVVAALTAGAYGLVAGRLEAKTSGQVVQALRPDADVARLRRLEQDADRLWPAHPDRIPALAEWIRQARDLHGGLEAHRAALDGLEERGLPPEADRTWRERLGTVIRGLEELRDERTGLLGAEALSPEHGWSAPRRLALARRLESGFAPGGEYAERWRAALPAIAAAYPGLELSPQMGLVPIGPDPATGLWEFWHVSTGVEPGRDEDGALEPSGEMGVVLVLLPAGTFWMGAQRESPEGRNHDPGAMPNEAPAHRVELSAFFLSKYELTRGQWLRLTGRRQDVQAVIWPTGQTLRHPVDSVSWQELTRWLPRVGLTLPSEAQWEYGCRAGTATPWWTGPERESLRTRRAANLADQSAARAEQTWGDIRDWPELDDGFPGSAPVGSFAPNGFGLHEVHGNLWEACLDAYSRSHAAGSSGPDPVVPPDVSDRVVGRGGSFMEGAAVARAALREAFTKASGPVFLGARPARAID